jgi:hypothetical protein
VVVSNSTQQPSSQSLVGPVPVEVNLA